MIRQQSLAQLTHQPQRTHCITATQTCHPIGLGKGAENHQIAVASDQAQSRACYQPQLVHRTQIIRCQLLAIGKFHIGLVHNNRAIYISENFFHSCQAVIVACRVVRIADNQQRRLLLLTKADNAVSINKAFGCQRIAHLLAVGKGSVFAVHGKRRPGYGNLFARPAKNIAGLFQQLAGAVADFYTVNIHIQLFGNNLAQVF